MGIRSAMTFETLSLLLGRGRQLISMLAVCVVIVAPLSACNMLQGLLVSTNSDHDKMQRIARDVMAVQTKRLMAQSTRASLANQKLRARVNALQSTRDGALSNVEYKLANLRQQLDAVARANAAQKVSLGEIKKLRRTLAALKKEIRQDNEHNRLMEASSRARFERLEQRTSKIKFPPGSGVIGVHLASYQSTEDARKGWLLLRAKYNIALGGLVPHYVDVDTVSGPFIRLMVGLGFPRTDLNKIITAVRAGGDYCMVMPLPYGAIVKSPTPTS